jgi:hypothetical protein
MENTTDTQEPEKEKSEAPSGQQYWWQNPLILTLLFAFIVGIFHFFFNRKKSKEVLIEKKVLLTLYKVNKRTFLKWVHFFCYTDTEEFATYCSKRKVTEAEYNYILLSLGEPSDSMPVRTKGEIVDHTEGSYETLRSDILDNLDEVGISKKVYNSLNIFPPLIALRIRDYYQRNVENATVHSF